MYFDFRKNDVLFYLYSPQSKIVFRTLPKDDHQQRLPDISLVREILDWEPHVSLEKGLDRTITYYRGRLTVAAEQDTGARANV